MAEAEARQKLRLAEGLARAADAAEGAIGAHARKQRAAGRRAEQAQAAAQAEADKARKVRVRFLSLIGQHCNLMVCSAAVHGAGSPLVSVHGASPHACDMLWRGLFWAVLHAPGQAWRARPCEADVLRGRIGDWGPRHALAAHTPQPW